MGMRWHVEDMVRISVDQIEKAEDTLCKGIHCRPFQRSDYEMLRDLHPTEDDLDKIRAEISRGYNQLYYNCQVNRPNTRKGDKYRPRVERRPVDRYAKARQQALEELLEYKDRLLHEQFAPDPEDPQYREYFEKQRALHPELYK